MKKITIDTFYTVPVDTRRIYDLRNYLSYLSHNYWCIYPVYLYDNDCVRIDIAALENWHRELKNARKLLLEENIADIHSNRLISLIYYNKNELTLAVDQTMEGIKKSDLIRNKETDRILADLRFYYHDQPIRYNNKND